MPHPRNYWKNKENVLSESKKYSSRTEFKRGSNCAYDSARKNTWLDEMVWLSNDVGKHPKGYWKDKENMMHEASKYKSKEEFKNGNLTAFLAAYRYGYIDDMDWLVKVKQHKWGYWTYENIEKEAMKYKTKKEFSEKCNTAYRAALKLGVIDDFFFEDYVIF